MYIEQLNLKNVRTFVDETIEFVHPDQEFRTKGKPEANGSGWLPKPRLPNVNLLLGDNGSGKSTILRAVAMAALGPSFADARLAAPGLVRRGCEQATLDADVLLHDQEGASGQRLHSALTISRLGELERIIAADDPWVRGRGLLWRPVFESKNEAFFAAGYGATRRVEAPENLDMAARTRLTFQRGQRLQGLFQESFTLIPLETWLPQKQLDNPGRYREVQGLLNHLLRPSRCKFTGDQERQVDYLFSLGGARIPFRWMSDGYRAFIGWVADLLYHACSVRPDPMKLVDLRGVVLVDEIDLHLHPRWQMRVISTIARTLPRMQFILTSHSPLVAGSLEWMNIITLKMNGRSNSTRARRLKESIHGLDADQVLLSEFFGLSTTRAEPKARELDRLALEAARGDDKAAELLISRLATGMEESE